MYALQRERYFCVNLKISYKHLIQYQKLKTYNQIIAFLNILTKESQKFKLVKKSINKDIDF